MKTIHMLDEKDVRQEVNDTLMRKMFVKKLMTHCLVLTRAGIGVKMVLFVKT